MKDEERKLIENIGLAFIRDHLHKEIENIIQKVLKEVEIEIRRLIGVKIYAYQNNEGVQIMFRTKDSE